MIRQFELVERVQSYDPDADEDMLNRAYVYGLKKHGTQMRASGDPYFSHPVEVAGILAEMKLDTASIVTGLLHDTIEDTDATRDEIARLFGESVARLVDGVTKLSRLEVQSESTKEAENLRKLVLAMSSDIRVLLVKLADRLHNMRTLHHIKDPARRRRIALETMDLYAPLASRIGMEKVKRELEELAFAELNPDGRASVLARQDYLRERGERLVPEIEAELIKTLKEGGLDAQVSGREKTPYSIWRKMQNKNVSFEQLADIMAFRIIVSDVAQCYQALGLLHGSYQVIPRPLQGLHLRPQAQRLPLAAHRRDRPAGPAHRNPDPHRGDAGPGRARRRRPLDLQAGRAVDGRAAVRLAAQPDRYPRQGAQRRGIPRAHQARDVPRPGVLLHAQGQADRPAARRDADRLRLCRAQPGRRHLRRLQDQRPHAAACAPSSRTATRSRSSPRRRRRRRRPGSASSSPARPRPRSAASSARASASSTCSSASRCSTRPSTRRATRSPRRASTACAPTSSRRPPTT